MGEARCIDGYTALHSACFFGRWDALQTLLGLGANIEARGTHGFTPLLSATLGARPKIMQALLEAGAYWDVESNGPERMTDVLERAERSDDDPRSQSEYREAWQECSRIVARWTDSTYEESFFYHALTTLLGIHTGGRCAEFSGWLQSAERYAPALTPALTLRAKLDAEAVVRSPAPVFPCNDSEPFVLKRQNALPPLFESMPAAGDLEAQ